MKKIIAALVSLMLISGCTINIYNGPEPTKEPEKEVTETEKPVKEVEETKETAAEPVKDENLINSMSEKEKRDINVFLSNFSEAYLGDYSKNGDDEQLLQFALVHIKANNTTKLEVAEIDGEPMYAAPASVVDELILRYFGREVRKGDFSERPAQGYDFVIYKDGKYYYPAADGEEYLNYSIAYNMVKNGDKYTVDFYTFTADSGMGSDCYSYTPEKAKATDTFVGKGRATVIKKTYNGEQKYELVDYKPEI